MDSDAIVCARRHQQALDALEFERGREAALLEQRDEVLTELEGPRIDAAAFARMEAEDVELVREALDPEQGSPEEEWLEFQGEPEAERLRREEREAERQRLILLIAECRRLQQALERYLEALGE